MYRQAFVACLRQSFLRAIHKGRENCGKVLLKEKNLTSRKTSEPKRETTMAVSIRQKKRSGTRPRISKIRGGQRRGKSSQKFPYTRFEAKDPPSTPFKRA